MGPFSPMKGFPLCALAPCRQDSPPRSLWHEKEPPKKTGSWEALR